MPISFFPEPNIIMQIGEVSLYLYGAMYVLGTIFCIWWLWWRLQKTITPLSFDTVSDFGVITLLGGVIGGRLGYIFIYNFSYYWQHPLDMLAVWHGGMSIHGGLLGGALAFLWMCKRKNVDWKLLADLLVPALAVALMLGRFGNFISGELVGRMTSMPWGVDFGDGIMRHPSQLYAMVKDFLLASSFGYLIIKYQDNPFWKSGQIFFAFLISYGVLRFIVEFFRAPDPQLGLLWLGLSMGQWLSVLVIGIGIVGVIWMKRSFLKFSH